MFRTQEDLKTYVAQNYPEVTDSRINDEHWDLLCTSCKITRGFQVVKRTLAGSLSTSYRGFDQDYSAPLTYLFRCPVCKAFKQWIVYELELQEEGGWRKHYYRVTSVPSEGMEEISELPETPPSLRVAYKQAVRAKDANANLAAAAMYRRAVQIITQDILGARSGTLAKELKEVVGKTYNGVKITSNFSDVGYIIKQAGNQGAHPDKDPDLLDFSIQDTEDLQQIFMELVSELFVVPAAAQKAKDAFLSRRKIEVSQAKTKIAPAKTGL